MVPPAARTASQSVGAWMSSAYQYQPPWLRSKGSKVVLDSTPCTAGGTPVSSVVWLA